MDRLVEPKKVDITYETDSPILYEVADGVAWIMMNRPDFNNAQNSQMTYAMDAAFRQAVDDDNVRRRDASGAFASGMGREFVDGHLHRLAARQRIEVHGEQFHVEGIGMIPVHVMQLRQREVPEVAIVRVHLEKGDRSVGQCFGDLARDRGLP